MNARDKNRTAEDWCKLRERWTVTKRRLEDEVTVEAQAKNQARSERDIDRKVSMEAALSLHEARKELKEAQERITELEAQCEKHVRGMETAWEIKGRAVAYKEAFETTLDRLVK